MAFIVFRNGKVYLRKPPSLKLGRSKKRTVRRRIARGMVKHTATEQKRLRVEARKIVEEKVAKWSAVYKVRVGRIAIRNQQSRWGSCSSKGNLNFNYRIATLPEELQDYLIVHELCHLREMNHGPAFWSLVAESIPEYKALDRRLKHYSLQDMKGSLQ